MYAKVGAIAEIHDAHVDSIPSTVQTREKKIRMPRPPSPDSPRYCIRTMLHRLPTELMLIIAELAAPRTAQDRQCLFINRRRWFASLAAISRSSWLALRPLIWTEVWIFERMVRALVDAVERDPSFAPFTKRLICTAISDDALTELHRVFPHFNNVRSVEIKLSGSWTAPLELSTVERLGGEAIVTRPAGLSRQRK